MSDQQRLTFAPIMVELSPEQYRERLAERPELGARWVLRAALSGVAAAQVGWGHMLLDGYGIRRDPEAAFRWFRLAARQKNLDAYNMIGRCYELGWGVEPDHGMAALWYGKAADGHDWAAFNLASLILAGDAEAADLRRALSLLVRAARGGNPKAMNMIGRLREAGRVVAPKLRSAALWFRWAAERGCFRGQFHFGRFLLGEGKPVEACRWFRSSLRQAPPDFLRDACDMLLRYPSGRVRRMLEEVLAERGDLIR